MWRIDDDDGSGRACRSEKYANRILATVLGEGGQLIVVSLVIHAGAPNRVRKPVRLLVLLLVAGAVIGIGLRSPGPAGDLAVRAGARMVPSLAGPGEPETLVSDLDTPWDVSWGPDDFIWVTERPGRISRVDPASGERTDVGHVEVAEVGEGGLMGLAFHPDFEAEPYVYVAHTYRDGSSILNRVVRARYDGRSLGAPEVVIDRIPGARNHNGSRLAFGADGFLYVTTGDASNIDNAQNHESLGGKVLRLTAEGDPAPGNPFGTAVYSLGHRNSQGLAFHPLTGVLYASEHGPSDNDEINRIVAGGNYGWPDVHGFCDGDIRGGETFCRDHEVMEPMTAWTPTVAVTGLDVYVSDGFAGWSESLLVTALSGTLYRLELSDDGNAIVGQEALYRRQFGRLRDVLVGPGGEIYLATSNRDGRGRPASDDDRIIRITP